MLALQRTIGNRATQRVLARRLTVKPDQLPVERDDTRRTQIKLIRQTLEGYETSRTAAERIPVLQYMQSIIKAWHDAGGQATSIGGQWLFRLLTEVEADLDEMKAQVEYMADLDKQLNYVANPQAGTPKFKYLSKLSPQAIKQAKNLAQGQTSAIVGEDQLSLDVMKQAALTDAEVAALKIYTVADFGYINPALAGADDWLKTNVKTSKDFSNDATPKGLRQAMAEGQRHGRFFKTGLEKLPLYGERKIAWRGMRKTRAEFAKQYALGDPAKLRGKQLPFTAFLSVSKTRAVAERFAYKPKQTDPKGATMISVMMQCKLINSRDVSGLSLLRDEAELVLPPPSILQIDDVKPDPAPNAPPDSYLIECTQIQ